MSKILTGILASVGTLGVVAGGVVAIDNIPATKGKINISYGETDIIGNSNKTKKDYEKLILKIQNDNKKMEDDIDLLNVAIANNNVEIARLQGDNNSKELQITELEAENNNKVAEIESLNASIEANNERIVELEKSEKDKSAEILELQAENQQKTEQILTLNTTIENNNETISSMGETISANEQEIASYQADILDKTTQIETLEIQVETNNSTILHLQSIVDAYEQALPDSALVTYVICGNVSSVLQDKGSLADYHASFPVGLISGWSKNEDGSNMLSSDYVVQPGDVLYAVHSHKATIPTISFTSEDIGEDGEFGRYNLKKVFGIDSYIYTFKGRDYFSNTTTCMLGCGQSGPVGLKPYVTSIKYKLLSGEELTVSGDYAINSPTTHSISLDGSYTIKITVPSWFYDRPLVVLCCDSNGSVTQDVEIVSFDIVFRKN